MGRSINSEIIISEIEAFSKNLEIINKKKHTEIPIYSSPRKRCIQTSKVISDKFKSSIQLEPSFDEIDYGDFEGKTIDEIKKIYPEEYELLITKPSLLKFPNGGDLISAQKLAYKKLLELSSEKEDLIIVTHVDIIKGILFSILENSFDMKKFIQIDNGSITAIEQYQDKFRIKYVNYPCN